MIIIPKMIPMTIPAITPPDNSSLSLPPPVLSDGGWTKGIIKNFK